MKWIIIMLEIMMGWAQNRVQMSQKTYAEQYFQEPQIVTEETIKNEEETDQYIVQPGSAGTLTIPNLLSVGLENGYSQSIVDSEYAAYWEQMTDCWYIADHNHQAFARLNEVTVDDICYINDTQYVCIRAEYGYVDPYLRWSDGEMAGDPWENRPNIIIYTCAGGNSRYITEWKAI